MFERFRRLSHELLKYATRGLLRKDFLPKVSEKIMAFSGADAIELWVKEDARKHFRCSVTASSKMPFGFILVPCPLGEQTGPPAADSRELSMERLSCDVINGSIDKSNPCVTARGSFWTGDSCEEMTLGEFAEGLSVSRSLRLPGPFKSVALIPILLDEECIGLLQLKSKKSKFFSIHDMSFYEDISEVLGVAISHQYAEIELRERIKELTCLFGIARVVAQKEVSLGEIIQGIVNLLPPGWLYPEIACAPHRPERPLLRDR